MVHKFETDMFNKYPQLSKLSAVTALALFGRWLFFAGSPPAVFLSGMIYVGVVIYLGWCVMKFFATRR